jgi:hypothetical protein
MDVFCGIDWAEGHHDVAVIDGTGKLLAKCRINDDLDGYQLLLDLLAEYGDSAETPIPVAIETSRSLLVATLRTGTRPAFAINPMAASRYRDRRGVSRRKSDPGDALGAGQHHPHRHADAPAAARRQRPGPGHRRAGPRPPGRRLEPAADLQPAPLAFDEVTAFPVASHTGVAAMQ